MQALFAMAMGRGDAAINLPPPTAAYRVYPDGREELVRGAFFKPVSYRALNEIVALGNEPVLLNTTALGQDVSVVAPAVLLRQVELAKPSREFAKPSFIPRPVVTETR